MFDAAHYATGGAATGTLRALCKGRPADCVVEVLDPLAIGPLRDIDRPEGLAQRKRYLQRLFGRIAEAELYERMAAGIGLPELGAAMPSAQRAIVWCGPNADEQLALRAASARWLNRALYVVDVGSAAGRIGPYRAVGACSVDELRVAEQRVRLLASEERAALAADWERLLRTDHRLRIFDNGQVVGCEDERFDPLLLAACPRDFASAARVVGQVMAESPHVIGDTFLDYRLRELIVSGTIEAVDATARLATMRVRHRAAV